MATPHKHAAIIKAWADGAGIEVRDPRPGSGKGGVWQSLLFSDSPGWYLDLEYRVKPQPHKHQALVDAVMAGATDVQMLIYLSAFLGGSENVLHTAQQGPKTPHNATNLKLTFEDGKLVKAEVI